MQYGGVCICAPRPTRVLGRHICMPPTSDVRLAQRVWKRMNEVGALLQQKEFNEKLDKKFGDVKDPFMAEALYAQYSPEQKIII